MPLLPGVQRLIDMAADGPSLADIPIQQARLQLDTLAASFGTGDRVGSTSDVDIPTPSGTVPARVYHPEGGGADLPPLLYFHGGGWSVGGLNTSDALCRKLTARSGGVVVNVDYRLAPENPYPAAVEDALAAAAWLSRNAADLNAGGPGILVGGDSAGGNLAAVVAQASRSTDEFTVRAQLLICAPVNLADRRGSYVEFAKGYFVSTSEFEHWISLYAPGQDLSAPQLSPAAATELAGTPAALIVTAEYDPLRDAGEEYARALRAAGVDVSLLRVAGQVHDFPVLGDLIPEGDEGVDDIVDRWRALLAGVPETNSA
ncbi:alpha/beta hydrolase [Streptomyces phaeochromogenes]|uniref:alpha/beta hydrolase n=1 Tax=Streptomyces phaeochromogenes TaxID=1923 RepID=UPI002DDAFAE9|nr:alpha/beta hydrolase [Streptomyces phaeochromogenes]WRZ26627.1 alpha/beta hydrolase [Streptomyces phaeochromogenes]